LDLDKLAAESAAYMLSKPDKPLSGPVKEQQEGGLVRLLSALQRLFAGV
jgi:hypothetical protein